MFGVFIFLATFIGITILLVQQMSTFITSVDPGDFQQLQGYSVIGGRQYVAWEPVEGYNVTMANTTHSFQAAVASHGSVPANKTLVFTSAEDDNDIIWGMVRGNEYYGSSWLEYPGPQKHTLFLDYFWIYQDQGWGDRPLRVISYDTIIEHQVGVLNESLVEFGLSGHKYALWVRTPGNGAAHSTYIENNVFNVALVYPVIDEDAKVSMWTILGQILTLQLPDTHWFVQIIMAIPLWASIGFMAFLIIRSVIPLLGG